MERDVEEEETVENWKKNIFQFQQPVKTARIIHYLMRHIKFLNTYIPFHQCQSRRRHK